MADQQANEDAGIASDTKILGTQSVKKQQVKKPVFKDSSEAAKFAARIADEKKAQYIKILEDNLNKDKVTINVKETKNADNFGYTATKIIINSGKEGASGMADKIKGILGTGEVSESSSNPDNVDITVIIGSDYTK